MLTVKEERKKKSWSQLIARDGAWNYLNKKSCESDRIFSQSRFRLPVHVRDFARENARVTINNGKRRSEVEKPLGVVRFWTFSKDS